jgi:hypothetical protein
MKLTALIGNRVEHSVNAFGLFILRSLTAQRPVQPRSYPPEAQDLGAVLPLFLPDLLEDRQYLPLDHFIIGPVVAPGRGYQLLGSLPVGHTPSYPHRSKRAGKSRPPQSASTHPARPVDLPRIRFGIDGQCSYLRTFFGLCTQTAISYDPIRYTDFGRS